MTEPINILLQTTIPFTPDDWHIGRFSLIKQHLESIKNDSGEPLYLVTGRDRENDADGNDPVLSVLDTAGFDQMWLFAVDTGDGLSTKDCEGITRFRQSGGGIFATRDHFDLGSSLCTLGGIGAAHYFNSKNPDPDETRNQRDDGFAMDIDFPNYHSGANGDYQEIETVGEIHELLQKPDGTAIKYFPAHPHEGGIGAPAGDNSARVIATGKSKVTGRDFNLIVAFDKSDDDHGNTLGRAIAESSFHHLVDYNWDTDAGCPTFLAEPPGTQYKDDPAKLDDIKQYVTNVAAWLGQNRER